MTVACYLDSLSLFDTSKLERTIMLRLEEVNKMDTDRVLSPSLVPNVILDKC